jgi:hypothetical protein
MLKVALTHDIDRITKTHQFFTKPVRAFLKFRMKEFIRLIISIKIKNSYWTFSKIIELEESLNIKSTYYFLNESIKFNLFKPRTLILSSGRYSFGNYKVQELIKNLHQKGNEIGLHGSYNSFKDKNLLKKEKLQLESIVGSKIIGIRQHYLNLNESTWKIQYESGFKYDSSYGSTSEIGFINYQYTPFNPLNNEFIVYPLIIMDTCFMNDPNRWKKLNEIINYCIENNSILVINFHNHVFNNLEYPDYMESYKRIIHECKLHNAVFKTLEEYYYEL